MKHMRFTAILATLILAAGCCQQPKFEIADLPAKWQFSTENTPLYEGTWTGEDHYLGAMTGAPAKITAVSADAADQGKFEYRIRGNKAEVNNLENGDYILFSTPVNYIEAGSHIEIDAVVMSSPHSPKYFIAEILDGKEWKSSETDLRTAEENPEIKYTFRCSGTGAKGYQHNSIYQTFRLDKAIKNGVLKIRFRVAADLSCKGEPLEKGKSAWVGFAEHGFVGSYIQNYGTEVPKDTTSVLCLGNSFTYYHNAPSLLKELAWSQGHYFDVFSHLKGGQTFGQHTSLLLTKDAIDAQVYDYAFLQDQSLAAARYAKDSKKYAYVPEDYLKLSEMVLEHSPECQIILEHTWGYEKENCMGFETVENLNNLLKEGVNYMAGLNGALASHIGDAFVEAKANKFNGNLYANDNHHQSFYGSYLKACVNYLLITKEPFNEKAADCGISADRAEQLRKTAEKIVLGK